MSIMCNNLARSTWSMLLDITFSCRQLRYLLKRWNATIIQRFLLLMFNIEQQQMFLLLLCHIFNIKIEAKKWGKKVIMWNIRNWENLKLELTFATLGCDSISLSQSCKVSSSSRFFQLLIFITTAWLRTFIITMWNVSLEKKGHVIVNKYKQNFCRKYH